MGCGSSTSQDGKAYAANKAVFDQFMAAWINKDTTASQLAGYIHEVRKKRCARELNGNIQ